jgi:phospholipid/cholesterol/gamma-HCH transport system substrate-binding protein
MSARVGLFFILGLALIWVTFESLSGGKLSRDNGYALVVHFKNLKELKKGDEVRMAGVRIGSVSTTQLDGRRAQATLKIDEKIQICKDATATIAMAGLLGSNYISIDLGNESSGFHSPGGEIKSVDTPDLNSLVTQLGDIGKKVDNALSDFNNAVGGKNGQGLLGKIEHLVDDNKDRVNDIAINLKELTEKANKGQGTIGKLLNDSKLHDELLASVSEIKGAATQAKDFVANAQSVIDQVKSGQGTLGVLIYDKEAGDNIRVVAKNFREISDKVNKGQGTVGKLINDDGLYIQAKGAINKLDRALDGMSDQGPISAVGAAAGALF